MQYLKHTYTKNLEKFAEHWERIGTGMECNERRETETSYFNRLFREDSFQEVIMLPVQGLCARHFKGQYSISQSLE